MAAKKKECNFVVKRVGTFTSQEGSNTITKPPNWSDLLPDLLHKILSRLFYNDQIRFRAVCRNWRLPLFPNSNDDLPCVVSYTWQLLIGPKKVEFSLFEPWQPTPYAVGELTCKFMLMTEVEILASKNGWLFLILKGLSILRHVHVFVLFSPFTKQIIQLPDLFCPLYLPSYKGTFSSNPTSSDCLFVVTLTSLCIKTWRYIVKICVYRPDACGTPTWTTLTISEFYNNIDNVELVGGTFYCVAYDGKLIKYDFSSLDYHISEPRVPQGRSSKQFCLIDHQGDLLAVTHDYELQTNKHFQLFLLDPLTNTWVQKEGLPNTALFLDRNTSFTVPATGDRRHMANKVFYLLPRGKIKIYSFEDRKSQEFGDEKPYCGWVSKKQKTTWLQPPRPPVYNYTLLR